MSSHAVVPCPPRTGILKNASILHQIVQVGKEDGRQTFEEFAETNGNLEEIKKTFAATGSVICDGNVQISAQITMKKNIGTTAGHAFRNPKTCQRLPVKNCYFHTHATPDTKYEIDMNSIKLEDPCVPGELGMDWAEFKLKKPAPVAPYKIPESDEYLTRDQEITQVTGISKDFKRRNIFPRHIQQCAVRKVGFTKDSFIKTDCTTGPGSSGSAQLDSNRTMVSLNVAEIVRKAPGTGFDPNSLYNISVPVAGEFRKAILEMARD